MGEPAFSPDPKPLKRDLPPILSSVPPSDPGIDVAPQKPKPPKSVSGFMENALDDAWDFAKGLYEILPSTVKSYQQNIPYIWKNLDAITPSMLFRFDPEGGEKDQIIKGEFKGAIPETMKSMLEAVKQPYKEHGAEVGYYKPVTVLGDLATVLTLGGGSIKNAGRLAKAAGAGEKAERLIAAGKWLEELPATAARKGVDLAVEGATGGKVNLAKRREFLALKGEEKARQIAKIQQDLDGVVKQIDALAPAEKELFHKARVGGGTAYGVAEEILDANPKVKSALDSYTELVNKVDPNLVDHGVTEFYKSRGLLDAETAKNSIAKKFALEAFDDVSDASVAKARKLIDEAEKAGLRAPVYGKNVFVDKAGKSLSDDTLLDDMLRGGTKTREGKVGSLEALMGAKGYTKDPSVYVREMLKDFRNTEMKARLSERLIENPKLIKGAAEGMTAEKLKQAAPHGINVRYYEDPIRAEALKGITDPTIQRLLKWEYIHNNSALVKVYDRMHSLFARSATMYNPKWVTGNIIGDAVLGMLAGSDWVEGMRQLKAGNMPYQIAAKNATLSTREITNPAGKMAKAVNYLPEKAADVAGYVDQATRAGIVTKEAGRRLKETALSFEGSAVQLEDVLNSTNRFSDLQVQMRLLEERAARSSLAVRQRDKELASLMQRERALAEKLEARELQKTIANQERLGTLEGKAQAKTQAADKLTAPQGPHDWMNQIGPNATEAEIAAAKSGAAAASAKVEAQRAKSVLGRTGEAGFEAGMSKLQDIRQRIVNITKERGDIVRDIMDDLAKNGELERLVPGLKQQVDILRPAVERANAFVGDYLALDGFEQGVMRRIIPFYPWAKAMSMLAFRLPFIAPVKSFAWNRFSDALATLTQDPSLPEDFKGRVPVAVTKDGKTVWVKLTTYSPFESLKTSQVGGVPVPQMFNLAERNPFIGLAFSFFGGKTVWDASSIPYGEQMVSIGDGTVLRVKPNGKIEREIPQTPLVSGVMHMFPWAQLAQQALQPYWTNKYNWAGMPEPVLNADGSYKYPRELWDMIGAAVGMNVMTRSREDIIRQRKLKAIKNVREMQAQYKRTSDPEEREFILNATKDYIQQEIHGGKK